MQYYTILTSIYKTPICMQFSGRSVFLSSRETSTVNMSPLSIFLDFNLNGFQSHLLPRDSSWQDNAGGQELSVKCSFRQPQPQFSFKRVSTVHKDFFSYLFLVILMMSLQQQLQLFSVMVLLWNSVRQIKSQLPRLSEQKSLKKKKLTQ